MATAKELQKELDALSEAHQQQTQQHQQLQQQFQQLQQLAQQAQGDSELFKSLLQKSNTEADQFRQFVNAAAQLLECNGDPNSVYQAISQLKQ
jgi:DNA-binding protein H-NS